MLKAWSDWVIKIKHKAEELEKKGDLRAALNFNLNAQATMANNFPSFLDTSPGTGSSGNASRLAPSPVAQQQQQNNNGNGAGMNGMPMAAGQQADVNFLFQKLVELSEVLKENREKTAGIIAGAEELAVSIATKAFKALYLCLTLLQPYVLIVANLFFESRLALQPKERAPPFRKPMQKSRVSLAYNVLVKSQ